MRYIFGFLIGIGLIILLFVLIFHRSGPAPAPTQSHKLVDYANTSTVVELTDDYPTNLDQNHNIVHSVVGRDQITLTVDQGYQGTVIRTQSYANNPTAYAAFLSGLQINGFTDGKPDPAKNDERGYCATGHRYIYEIKDGSRVIQRLWSTSCGNIGTFKGKTSTISILFRRQIPDFSKLTGGLETNL